MATNKRSIGWDYHIHGTGTSSTDNAAFAKLVAAYNATNGGHIKVSGTLSINGLHQLTSEGSLECIRGGIIHFDGDSALIQVATTTNDPFGDAGAKTISATSTDQSYVSGASLGLVQGDWIAVWADNEVAAPLTRDSSGIEYRPLEMHKIVKPVRLSSTDFVIDGYIHDALTTTPKILKLTPIPYFHMRNVRTLHKPGSTNAADQSFRFQRVVGLRIENCLFESPSPGQLGLYYVSDVLIHGCRFGEKYDPDESAAMSGEGYGITCSVTANTDIAHNTFGFMRHGITTGFRSYSGHGYGVERGLRIRNNKHYNANYITSGGSPVAVQTIDTHASGWEVEISGNTIELEKRSGATTVGIVTRSRNAKIIGNTIHGGASATNIGVDVYGPGTVISGNRFEKLWCGVRLRNLGTDVTSTTGTLIERNTFSNCNGPGVNVQYGDDQTIRGNTFDDVGHTAQSYGRGCIRIRGGRDGHRIESNEMRKYTAAESVGSGNDLSVIYYAESAAATFDNATDTWTATAHPFRNDDRVQLTTSGSLPTGAALLTDYYVINRATNTFQLSATEGGASVDWSTDGSGNTATLSRAAGDFAEIVGNNTSGYGDGNGLGLDKTDSVTFDLERNWNAKNYAARDLMTVAKTAHGFGAALLYAPILADDTEYDGASTVPILGILVDHTDDDNYTVLRSGATITLPDTILGASYTVGTDGRLLYWQNGTDDYRVTVNGKVILLVIEQRASTLVCEVVGV